MDYGSGAVMAVPGHDQRDWEFATQYTNQTRHQAYDDDPDYDISKRMV